MSLVGDFNEVHLAAATFAHGVYRRGAQDIGVLAANDEQRDTVEERVVRAPSAARR